MEYTSLRTHSHVHTERESKMYTTLNVHTYDSPSVNK